MRRPTVPEVRRLVPHPGVVDAAALVEALRDAQAGLRPFDPAVLACTADLSRRLRRHPEVRAHPAIGALAWWIRPAGIAVLQRHWEHLCDVPGIVRVPRGVVFHVPPTNVDTMFVYSWLLSALSGNANVVRLSGAAAEAPGPLLATLAETIEDHPAVAASTAIVTYGHDDAVTGELSQADVRVIWGGDATVAAIRSVPMAPRATELAFPDRFSFAVLDAPAVLAADDVRMAELVAGFVNDAYWFDQLGCASPRLIVWRGEPATVDAASGRFRAVLGARLSARDEHAATSTVVAKLVHAAASAADGVVSAIDWSDNDATIATLTDLGRIPRDSPGGGLFYEARVDALDDLVPYVRRRDQTVTHDGLTEEEIVDFVRTVGARGIDRVVPVGQALTFHHHWDGHDLLQSLSRSVQVDAGSRAAVPGAPEASR
jgi:hypothetical protein